MFFDRFRFRNLIVLLLSLAFAACGKKDRAGGSSSSGSHAPAQVLRMSNGTEPRDIDPQVVEGIPELHVIQALSEGLLDEDPHDLHPTPGVAKSWDVSPDGLVYTFHLREDAKWSNGDLITAQDFLDSYKRMLTPALGSKYSYLLWYVAGAEEYNKGTLTDFSQVGFKAQDAHTLVVTLHIPTPFLLGIIANHYAWHPVPVKVIAKFGGMDKRATNWTRPENFVGNGPFVLKEWLPGKKIVVTRSPTYWDRQNVKLDEVDFYPVDDINAEERMFRAGQIDMTQEVTQAKIDSYRREMAAAIHTDPWLGIYFYRFNTAVAPYNDKRVRRALALAIDREAIVKNVTRGNEIPAYSIIYPGTAGYFPKAKLQGDIAEAKRLLAEAGYPDGKGFPTMELIYNNNQNHRVIAETIQQMWRRDLGINLSLANQEWGVYIDNQHNQNFQLERAGWIADYIDPHVFLEIWRTKNLNNDSNWGNPEYDRLLDASLKTRTTEERYEVYQKLEAILVDELPVIPIFFYTRPHLINPKVQGYYPTLLDNHPFKFIYMGE